MTTIYSAESKHILKPRRLYQLSTPDPLIKAHPQYQDIIKARDLEKSTLHVEHLLLIYLSSPHNPT